MVKTLGEESPCYYTVKKCVADFKRGRDGTDVHARTGRPKSESATIDAYLEVIHRMVMNDGV